jgi:alpha-D-ribose 1-methylphosphonate 5-triphosphate synthase subunit PhnH
MSASGAMTMSRGFANPALDSQAVFRAILKAMSEPGRVIECPVPVPSAPLPPVIAAVALTMLDYETPIFLAGDLSREAPAAFLAFHTGAPLVSKPGQASVVLALAPNELPPIAELEAGTPAYPDRSATVIVGVTGFGGGTPVSLRGAGIAGSRDFMAGGLHTAFWKAAIENAARFPLGVDFIFCGLRSLAAMPRSTIPDLLRSD